MEARGLGSATALDTGALEASAVFEQGEWRVLFRYPLAAVDSAAGTLLPLNQAVPMAFMVQDGDNGETGGRGAVSSWYYVQLTEPTPPTVYAMPVLAVLLTAGLGVLVVRRAQRRAATAPTAEPAPAAV